MYTDCADIGSYFQSIGAEFFVLPEIELLGVKRAKFSAYAHAAKSGGFVYLDADVIVLQTLDAFDGVSNFTACRDDLSECDFVRDRMRPWENHPDCSGARYFNSGVFAVPAGLGWFFEKIRLESLDDRDWEGAIVPGKLYDNHYLCLKIVQNDVDVDFVSEVKYNWQGFRRFGELNCYVSEEGVLCNRGDGGLLHLVHFAGVRDIDRYISTLPAEIADILARSLGSNHVGVLELMNSAACINVGVDLRSKLNLISAMTTPSGVEALFPGADVPVLGNHGAAASIVFSTNETGFVWNGLKCGSAYLSAEEYVSLREFIKRQNIESVLEFGAGYTTVLFASLVKTQLAIEGWEGPWLEFARSRGCNAKLVEFVSDKGFSEYELAEAVACALSGTGKRLVFIDSPPGKANRAVVTEQIIRYASDADFYVVHDSVRDSENVFRLAAALDLRVVGHFASLRGMTFLARRSLADIAMEPETVGALDGVSHIRFEVRVEELEIGADGSRRIFVTLCNHGDVTIPSAGQDGLRFSLHLYGSDGKLVEWDTPRYSLPVCLAPEDAVSFWMDIRADYSNVAFAGCDFVKEGEFWWSRIAGVPAPVIELRV
ncbi:hypothetical protein [Niveibacterium sp. COAC-50]|uniref:hypothetical protein n=1 Tax=Niveibacterium sp. COAC-50 TaxID=2729384 RepID=UPI001552A2FA|nr:hypothetical protein [Niveibacterium sp. COAC-50]